MAVVRSVGALVDVVPGWQAPLMRTSLRFYDQYNYDYATLYRTQPNVRTCVDFLARNIAQLGLHVFRRAGETDRARLRAEDHPLAAALERPLPAEFKVTRYRLIEQLMGDLGVYFNAYWLKVRVGGEGRGNPAPTLGLLRIPPPLVEVKGGIVPTGYEVTLGGQVQKLGVEEVVHFRGYSAENAVTGLSPLETLRRVLAEEHAMGDYREYFWQNAARMGGVIERPKGAPEWSTRARERFKAEFEALYSGGENSGRTAILEEGMTWRPGTFNAQESEYLGGRKLTREECARAYHIPLPMVGILDHATFSNIKEQHKNLYQDSLGPWLAMIELEVELQLLPEFDDSAGVYVEFNIQEKLQGSFEEQVKALQSAVGRPWMTADEARARLNLPSMGGEAEELVTPLNVVVGGLASARDTGEKSTNHKSKIENQKREGEIDGTVSEMREGYREKWGRLMARTFERQRAVVMSMIPKGAKQIPDPAVLWDSERWNREVGADFYRLSAATAMEFGRHVAGLLEIELQEEELLPWLEENARIAAEQVNQTTRNQIEEGLLAEAPREALGAVFEQALGVRAGEVATTRTTTLANFGALEGAKQGGMRSKTWLVHSGNPRPSHAAQNGMTIEIRDIFPNGQRWPGDPAGGADENANCQCSVAFGK